MIKGISLITLLSASLLLGTAKGAASEETKLLEADTNIIVSLDQDPFTCSKEEMNLAQNALVSDIKYLTGSKVEVLNKFNKSISAVELKVNSAVVNKIRNFDYVSHIDYNKFHKVTTNSDGAVSNTYSVESIEEDKENISATTMNTPENSNEGEGTLIAILDNSFMIDGFYEDDSGTKHSHVAHEIYTPLDQGVSLKIADQSALHTLIDGDPTFHGKYDANHSTYFNNKVPFYYDYGGDYSSIQEYNESETYPDNDYDVFAPQEEHGNHVASIAAGNAPHYKGIAPKAQLALMKVFLCAAPTEEEASSGKAPVCGAMDSDIIEALEDCITLGVDIINMSLGSALDDFDRNGAGLTALANCRRAGIFCAVAAGNDGRNTYNNTPYEFWSTDVVETGILGLYANSEESFIVGAANPTKQFIEKGLKIGDFIIEYDDQVVERGTMSYDVEHKLMDLLDLFPDKEFPWVRVGGWGELADYDDLDVNGKLAVVDRGETTFADKVQTAISKGAVAVGIIDNDASATEFNFTMDFGGYQPTVPVFSILFRDKAKIDSVQTDTAYLIVEQEDDNPDKGTVVGFSSDGVTYDLRIKPDISAPGYSILGAVASSDTAYEYYNGTSMATPNIAGAISLLLSEHLNDDDWRDSLYSRMMSTANIMNDQTNTPHFDSVRRQGSGMIDVKGALETNAYLTGNTKGTANDRAKIELGNAGDIKEGKVSLTFEITNTSDNEITYNATTYVERPELVENNPERYEELGNHKLQATYDHLIGTAPNTITVGANETKTVTLPTYEIPQNELDIIDANFENGTYIEGYVVLEATDEETLNIPYLGFYGDYSKGAPVEPFKHEKEQDKVYQSDIMRSLLSRVDATADCDMSSDAIIGHYKTIADVDLYDWEVCSKPLTYTHDGDGNLVAKAFNKLPGNDEYQIIANNKLSTNTLIMQQFVTRSVLTNTVTFTNKSTSEIVNVDHMYDMPYGPIVNNEGEEIQWPLYKSYLNDSSWGVYYCHRAYSIFPLYESTYDEVNEKYIVGDLWESGEYEIKMNYTLTDGSTYETSYTLVIDTSSPIIKSISKVDSSTFRIRYAGEIPMSSVTIAATACEIKYDADGYYVDYKVDKRTPDTLWLRSINLTKATVYAITHLSDPYNLVLENEKFTKKDTYDFASVITDVEGSNGKSFTLNVKKGTKAQTLTADSTIRLDATSFVTEDELKVEVLNNGNYEAIAFTRNGNYISFTTKLLTFRIYSGDIVAPQPGPIDPPAPEEPSDSKGCGGSLVASTLVLSLTAALGATMLIGKKKKEEK